MQEAVPPGVGAMAAILGLDPGVVREVVETVTSAQAVCAVANLNAPGQTVIAGHRDAVESAVDEAKTRGRETGGSTARLRAFSLAADGSRTRGDGSSSRGRDYFGSSGAGGL